MPQMLQVLRERAIGMLTAGMSTRAVAPWIECSFLYHKPSPKAFQRIWQYIQPTSQPQTTCNHTSPGPPHPASSPPRSSETRHPGQLLQQSVCITKEFLHKLSKTVSWKLICCSSSSSGSQPDCSWSFDGVWRFGEVFSSRMNPGFHCMALCGWAVCWCQRCWSSGPWWQWGYGIGRCMLRTQVNFIDGISNCCAIHPRPSPHVAAW